MTIEESFKEHLANHPNGIAFFFARDKEGHLAVRKVLVEDIPKLHEKWKWVFNPNQLGTMPTLVEK